jgi:hypothetical protein
MALSDQSGNGVGQVIACPDEPQIPSETAFSVPLFQLVTRGDPPGRDDVRAVSALTAKCRRFAVRARHRHQPRDSCTHPAKAAAESEVSNEL